MGAGTVLDTCHSGTDLAGKQEAGDVTDIHLVCWKCGAGLDDIPLPLSRYAECPGCATELHVCRMCRFYDQSVANQCREPVAEFVRDKTRANFCGYLEPTARAYRPDDGSAATQAGQSLEALFGGAATGDKTASGTSPDALSELESLFGDDKQK